MSLFVLFRSLLLGLIVTSCVGTTPPSNFYLLEPLAKPPAHQSNSSNTQWVLALTPVKIPGYLDRTPLVSATDKNSYSLNELHRWAESLDENITRVVLQDLSALLPADVVLSSTPRARQATLKLSINILEFHLAPQGQAKLNAQWQISRGDEMVVSQHDEYHVMASRDDIQLKVQALNQCLLQLNQAVASAILASEQGKMH